LLKFLTFEITFPLPKGLSKKSTTSTCGENERRFLLIKPGILNSDFYVPPTNPVLKNVKEWD